MLVQAVTYACGAIEPECDVNEFEMCGFVWAILIEVRYVGPSATFRAY